MGKIIFLDKISPRKQKLENAKTMIYEPLVTIIKKHKKPIQEEILTIFLMPQDKKFIEIDSYGFFKIPNLTNWEIENMLALLRDFDLLISYQPIFVRTLFIVKIRISPLTAKSKGIFQASKKAA